MLDCARGVAIICVLLCHTLASVYGDECIPWNGLIRDLFGSPLSTLLLFPLSMGQAGVAIFFVISGFCIHLSYQQHGGGWGGFFVRRVFRIWPAYVPTVILFVALNSIGDYLGVFKTSHDRAGLFSHLFLVHNYNRENFTAISGSFWSLAVEAQLYLLYPIFRFILSKLGWRATLWLLAVGEVVNTGLGGVFSMLPFAYWFSWALGARLADAFLRRDLTTMSGLPLFWPIALAISVYCFKPLSHFWFTAWAITTAVVFSRVLNAQRANLAPPRRSNQLLRSIGLWSYSLYLLHHPLLTVYYFPISAALPEGLSRPAQFAVVCCTWIAIIPFSILWYKCFELPGVQLGKWIASRFNPRPWARISLRPTQVFVSLALVVFLAGTFLAKAGFSPKSPEEGNNLAWELATNPEASKRDGRLAVKYAEQACRQTGYENAVMVGTLAAAYAEAGRFQDAIGAASLACTLASRNSDQNLLPKNQELLNLYLSHQPFHRPN
jgi:peptidoglycan/LPS O-acetylase OafA/YrhL